MTLEKLLQEISNTEQKISQLNTYISRIKTSESMTIKLPPTEKVYDNQGVSWGDNSLSIELSEVHRKKLFEIIRETYLNYLENELESAENYLAELKQVKEKAESVLEE